jgi:hypothetical protein
MLPRLLLVLLLTSLPTALLPSAASASVLRYTFSGQVNSVIELYPLSGGGDRQVSSSDLAGAPIRVGDPFEAVLNLTPRDPYQVNTWDSWITTRYSFPRDSYTFNFKIGGHAFADPPEANSFEILVDTGRGQDHVTAYTRTDYIPDFHSSTWQEIQLVPRAGVALGTGLPTDPSAFDLNQSYLVMRPYTKDWSLQVVLKLESIQIESDGVLPPGGGPGPGAGGDPGPGGGDVPPTPIPEPAAFIVFAGLAAVLAARHHRAQCGLGVS